MIRVLVVDDSQFMQKQLLRILKGHADIEVIDTASDPYSARDKIVQLCPDVVTLDLEMPRMDGLTFLRKIMRYYPLPVIIVSSITPKGSLTAIEALALGAIDVVCKPGQDQYPEFARTLLEKIRMAAKASLNRIEVGVALSVGLNAGQLEDKLLAIGASTGGTEAITKIMKALPPELPGTVIVQHLPANFSAAFAKRLDEECSWQVREAKAGEVLKPGLALIAPGGKHLLIRQEGGKYRTLLKEGPTVHYQRPSVEVLFESVAKAAGRNAVGVILTGMGEDGAQGLWEMRQNGAITIAQDAASSVVYGMPKAAAKLEAASVIRSLADIPNEIVQAFAKRQMKANIGNL